MKHLHHFTNKYIPHNPKYIFVIDAFAEILNLFSCTLDKYPYCCDQQIIPACKWTYILIWAFKDVQLNVGGSRMGFTLAFYARVQSIDASTRIATNIVPDF